MHHCETNPNPERRRTQNGGGELGAWMAGWSRSCDTYQAGCGCGTFTDTSFRASDRCVGVGVGVGVGMGELVIPPRRMSYTDINLVIATATTDFFCPSPRTLGAVGDVRVVDPATQ
jgi:hypothetical protein